MTHQRSREGLHRSGELLNHRDQGALAGAAGVGAAHALVPGVQEPWTLRISGGLELALQIPSKVRSWRGVAQWFHRHQMVTW